MLAFLFVACVVLVIAIERRGCGICERTILAWISRGFVWILCTFSIGGGANEPEPPGNRSSPKVSMQAVENFAKEPVVCDFRA